MCDSVGTGYAKILEQFVNCATYPVIIQHNLTEFNTNDKMYKILYYSKLIKTSI